MYRDDHGIMHFEDDGGPPARERTLRIGILNASGNPVAPPSPTATESEPTPAAPSVDWPTYCTWRETKCRPYNLVGGPELATCGDSDRNISKPGAGEIISRDRALEEIDQATHELVGEVAEVAELVMENGPEVFRGEPRTKFIDECGDILFCASWALDAWGENPCRQAPEGVTELVTIEPGHEHAGKKVGEMLRAGQNLNEDGGLRFMEFVMQAVCLTQIYVGLTANAFKKLRFQRRKQDVPAQRDRIIQALVHVNILLITAGSSMAEAMTVNQRKLNARYKDGYQPGMGGGDRTGAGA